MERMKKLLLCFFVFLLVPIVSAYNISVEVQLTNPDTGAVITGTHTVNITIYNSTDNGIFTNQTSETLDANGRFHKYYDVTYNFSDNTYVAWKIDSDAQTSKTMIAYVPNAINAEYLRGFDSNYFLSNATFYDYLDNLNVSNLTATENITTIDFNSTGNMFTSIISCSEALETNASGGIICGTDVNTHWNIRSDFINNTYTLELNWTSINDTIDDRENHTDNYWEINVSDFYNNSGTLELNHTTIIVTNLGATNISTTNLTSTNITTTDLNVTGDAYISGTISADDINASNVSLTNLTAVNITTTDLTVTNIGATNISTTNLTSTNITTTDFNSTGDAYMNFLSLTDFLSINVTANNITVTENLTTVDLNYTGSFFTSITSCSEALETDASGKVVCGNDTWWPLTEKDFINEGNVLALNWTSLNNTYVYNGTSANLSSFYLPNLSITQNTTTVSFQPVGLDLCFGNCTT